MTPRTRLGEMPASRTATRHDRWRIRWVPSIKRWTAGPEGPGVHAEFRVPQRLFTTWQAALAYTNSRIKELNR